MYTEIEELYHSIDDAERLMHYQQLELSDKLPWKSVEALEFLTFSGRFRSSRCFFYDFREDRCFSVSSDDILSPEDIKQYWPLVDRADMAEIESFVNNKCFACNRRDDPEIDNLVGGT